MLEKLTTVGLIISIAASLVWFLASLFVFGKALIDEVPAAAISSLRMIFLSVFSLTLFTSLLSIRRRLDSSVQDKASR